MILRKLFPFEVIQSISTDNFFKLITFRVIDFKEWISRDTNQLSKFKNRDTQLTTKLEFIDGILIFLFSERLVKWARDPNHLPKMVGHKLIVGNLVMLFDCK